MQFTIAVVAAFAASVYAQVTPEACLTQAEAVPTCALSCISSAASRAGCGQYDLACQCGTASSAINSYAEGCVINACTPISNALAVASSAAAVCSCVATAPSSAQAATTSAAAAGGSSAGSSMASMTSAASMATTSAAVSQQSDGQVTASSAMVVSQISDGQPQGTTASVPIVTGGAATLGALGGVAGAILGVAALL